MGETGRRDNLSCLLLAISTFFNSLLFCGPNPLTSGNLIPADSSRELKTKSLVRLKGPLLTWSSLTLHESERREKEECLAYTRTYTDTHTHTHTHTRTHTHTLWIDPTTCFINSTIVHAYIHIYLHMYVCTYI